MCLGSIKTFLLKATCFCVFFFFAINFMLRRISLFFSCTSSTSLPGWENHIFQVVITHNRINDRETHSNGISHVSDTCVYGIKLRTAHTSQMSQEQKKINIVSKYFRTLSILHKFNCWKNQSNWRPDNSNITITNNNKCLRT